MSKSDVLGLLVIVLSLLLAVACALLLFYWFFIKRTAEEAFANLYTACKDAGIDLSGAKVSSFIQDIFDKRMRDKQAAIDAFDALEKLSKFVRDGSYRISELEQEGWNTTDTCTAVLNTVGISLKEIKKLIR